MAATRRLQGVIGFVKRKISEALASFQKSLQDDDDRLLLTEKRLEPHTPSRYSQIGWQLVPSYVARRYGRSDVKPSKPNATSYLNGLRGVAAIVVVIVHSSAEWFYWITVSYKRTPPDNRILQLPFVRIFVSGHFMVAIFFICSGFALAYGPLKKAHAGDSTAALAGLPGSTVRRPIRLFLPVLPVFIATSIAVWLQIFWQDYSTDHAPSTGSLFADISGGLRDWTYLSWRPLDWETWQPDNVPVCWTLNIELQGSFAVFVMIMALVRVPPWLRMSVVAMCAWDALHNHPGRYPIFLFLSGMILADLRHLRAKLSHQSHSVKQAVTFGSYLLLTVALFFGTWPVRDAENGWLYSYFARWPNYGQEHHGANFFWLSMATVMLMVSMENLPKVQDIFNHPVCLYLADISYSLYLTHYFILHTLGRSIIFGLRHWGVGNSVSAIIGGLIAGAVSIMFADVYWRLVETKLGEVARLIVEKMGV
jgi:peptidoglycan/LPS O-acetylase OafA/YrhL